MRKYKILFTIFVLFLTQSLFAMDSIGTPSKQCEMIATACLNAGYTKNDEGDKAFWMGCMKPVLLGKSVDNVSVDAKDVKACRVAKIKDLQQVLKALEAVKS